MTNHVLINTLSPNLKIILDDELKAGNSIQETSTGGFTNCQNNHLFILLIILDKTGFTYYNFG